VDGRPEFEAGDWCRFCPIGGSGGVDGRPVCEAYVRHNMAAAGVFTAAEALPQTAQQLASTAMTFAARDTRTLTPEQIVGLLDAREALAGALSAVEAWATELLQLPEPPAVLAERYKPVRGRTNRRWKLDAEQTFQALRKFRIADPDKGKDRLLGKKDLYEETLKSPAAVEKLLSHAGIDKQSTRWQVFLELMEKPLGKISIAPVEDPRPCVRPEPADPEELFGDAPAF
jgi:hypothetical protein